MLALCLMAVAAAQQAAQDFAGNLATFRAADAATAARAAAAAFRSYQAAPVAEWKVAALPEALEAALAAGLAAAALPLLPPPEQPQPALLPQQLGIYLQLQRLADFVRCAEAASAAGLGQQVEQLLRDAELQLLPLADAAMRRGDTELGRYVFAALAALPPPSAVRLANHGLCLRQLGEFAAAAACYVAARELAPSDAQIANDHGLLLRAAGQVEAAIAAFRRSLELDAASAGGLRGQGPAVTNLLHAVALGDAVQGEPLPAAEVLPLAAAALRLRPNAAMLRQLWLDVGLDDATAALPAGVAATSTAGAVATTWTQFRCPTGPGSGGADCRDGLQ